MVDKDKKRAVIIGAGGYTGVELIRLLRLHPYVELAALVGNTQAGKMVSESYSHLKTADLPPLVTLEEVDFSAVDVVFFCLPHGTVQEVIAALPERSVSVVQFWDAMGYQPLTDPSANMNRIVASTVLEPVAEAILMDSKEVG